MKTINTKNALRLGYGKKTDKKLTMSREELKKEFHKYDFIVDPNILQNPFLWDLTHTLNVKDILDELENIKNTKKEKFRLILDADSFYINRPTFIIECCYDDSDKYTQKELYLTVFYIRNLLNKWDATKYIPPNYDLAIKNDERYYHNFHTINFGKIHNVTKGKNRELFGNYFIHDSGVVIRCEDDPKLSKQYITSENGKLTTVYPPRIGLLITVHVIIAALFFIYAYFLS